MFEHASWIVHPQNRLYVPVCYEIQTPVQATLVIDGVEQTVSAGKYVF